MDVASDQEAWRKLLGFMLMGGSMIFGAIDGESPSFRKESERLILENSTTHAYHWEFDRYNESPCDLRSFRDGGLSHVSSFISDSTSFAGVELNSSTNHRWSCLESQPIIWSLPGIAWLDFVIITVSRLLIESSPEAYSNN